MGVTPDPMRGVVVTKIEPGGAGARHNLEVGSTFTMIDGTDALRIDKAELLHMLKTKTTATVELGPGVGGMPKGPQTTSNVQCMVARAFPQPPILRRNAPRD